MNIETLVLSGGSTSGIAYIGVFKALLEHNIDIYDFSTISVLIWYFFYIFYYLFGLKNFPI